MRSALCATLVALIVLAVTPAAGGAASLPQIGRYKGKTGDGHVFQFSVERSQKANSSRKITHIWLVYDIAGCRSGPVRQPFFASVFKTPASPYGAFSRTIPKTDGHADQVQLRLKGRFTSTTRASGSFRVGVIGKCPITPSTDALSFTATRSG
ncbi:MAG TPA: hypothetical protein VH834_22360 [Solirubrobacteraceae bacterium]